MPSHVPELDLDLAFDRVRRDVIRGRTFFRHPHELILIDQDRPAWIAALRDELAAYVPGDLYLANVVKPSGGLRPGGILSIRDQVIYAALVGRLSASVRQALDWSGETVDYSYPISTNASNVEWFERNFPLWRQFEADSVRKIDEWAQFVVFLDVAAYYEHIDLGLLLSDLRGIGAPADVLELLSRCLNKWSQAAVPGRSVPQGFSASDILARFYLNRFDRSLREREVHHLRYVDDIRIFARSHSEAKKSLAEAIVCLRKRGLAVQTAKLEVADQAHARARIEGLLPALRTILRDFVDSIAEIFGISDPYFSLPRAETMLSQNANNAPVGLIREAYRRYFLQPANGPFNKTLFHFLLRRLARASDSFAFDHVLQVLRDEPQETAEVLSYLEGIERVADADASILSYLGSVDAVYPHQVYEVIAWRTRVAPLPGNEFVSFVRTRQQESNNPPYLRSACREFLARFGSEGDIDRMHEILLTTSEDLERAELICAVRRMEAGRRNGVLVRYRGAGPYSDRAIACVRNNGFARV